jgi:hypothetical protein
MATPDEDDAAALAEALREQITELEAALTGLIDAEQSDEAAELTAALAESRAALLELCSSTSTAPSLALQQQPLDAGELEQSVPPEWLHPGVACTCVWLLLMMAASRC